MSDSERANISTPTPSETEGLSTEIPSTEIPSAEIPSTEISSAETPDTETTNSETITTTSFQKALAVGKPPQPVFPEVVAFPPNRETLGGTSYLIETAAGNILVDSPPWTETTQSYLQERGVRWLFLTQRNAIAQVKTIQQSLDCEVVIQEQEAYLLPNIETTSFHRELAISEALTALWTSGFSPGAACLHWSGAGGVLFTGRHLLPTRQGNCSPLRTAKTFHWPRQLRSLKMLQNHFAPEQLQYICPGASIGFLRGKHAIDDAYARLQALDLDALEGMAIGL